MKYKYLMTGFIMPVLFASGNPVAVSAEHQQHRDHGAHEHGTASLNIAIENSSLYIELESPAMNIVGFEHQPTNDKQTRAVKQATNLLKKATQQFGLPVAAQCTVSNIQVKSPLLIKQEKPTDEHSEFHASYIFNCKNISALININVMLFKTFKRMSEIDVQLISSTGQTIKELTAGHSMLVIKP